MGLRLGTRPPRMNGGDCGEAEHQRKVLLVVNVDWFFWSHRLPIARGLARAGYEVVVAAGTEGGDYPARIEAEGFRFVRLSMRRGTASLLAEWRSFLQLVALYRRERPDVVHHVTIKPVLYGTVAARLAGVPRIVEAFSGLGFVAGESGRFARTRRRALFLAYRAMLSSRRVWAIFQNRDDLARFVGRGVVAPERAVLIRGSGVDLVRFRPRPEPAGAPVVLFASRLLWDKGVGELVAACERLRREGRRFRLVLAGRVDRENPCGIPEERLRAWQAEGRCEWRGLVEDMPGLLAEASVVVLASSYREGAPKILLEAGAAGRAIVASDEPGCREIARAGENALLVPARDADALADALGRLLDDRRLRRRLGRSGREIVEREFGEERIVAETLALYGRLASEVGVPGEGRGVAA